MRRWLLWIGTGFVLLVLGLLILGTRLPREHVASSRIILRQPAESLWAVIRNIRDMPAWWPAVTTVEAIDRGDGRERWREEVDGFEMAILVEEIEPGRQFRTVIQSAPEASFGGQWTYALTAVEGGTEVRVTESGWIGNPLFRVMARVAGVHGSLDSYLGALARRFGEAAEPEHLAGVM